MAPPMPKRHIPRPMPMLLPPPIPLFMPCRKAPPMPPPPISSPPPPMHVPAGLRWRNLGGGPPTGGGGGGRFGG
eukprot:scaffold99033_cov31-Tisochrysis_lutea.AAC.3